MIHGDETLGQVATTHPEATLVFLKHRLDFCCGGGQKLVDACQKAGIEAAQVIAEIEAANRPVEAPRWDAAPLSELIEFIVTTYHEPLRQDVPAWIEAAKRVERVHAQKPSCPHGLAALLEHMYAELMSHLAKEEQILFPAIFANNHGGMIQMPIRVMLHEHDEHGANLKRLRTLATEFVAPPEACATWRALYTGLAKLEAELMEHIHLENNVLFPRAMVV